MKNGLANLKKVSEFSIELNTYAFDIHSGLKHAKKDESDAPHDRRYRKSFIY